MKKLLLALYHPLDLSRAYHLRRPLLYVERDVTSNPHYTEYIVTAFNLHGRTKCIIRALVAP